MRCCLLLPPDLAGCAQVALLVERSQEMMRDRQPSQAELVEVSAVLRSLTTAWAGALFIQGWLACGCQQTAARSLMQTCLSDPATAAT